MYLVRVAFILAVLLVPAQQAWAQLHAPLVDTNAYFTARVGDMFVVELVDEWDRTIITSFAATVSPSGTVDLFDTRGQTITNVAIAGADTFSAVSKIFGVYARSHIPTNVAVSVRPPARLKTSPIHCPSKMLRQRDKGPAVRRRREYPQMHYWTPQEIDRWERETGDKFSTGNPQKKSRRPTK